MVSKTDKYLASWGSDRRLSADALEAKNLGSFTDFEIVVDGSQKSWIEGMTLVDAAVHQLIRQSKQSGEDLPTDGAIFPKDIALTLGKLTVTVAEYLGELRRLGIDTDGLQRQAKEFERNYRDSQAASEEKAQKLFDLMLESPFFTDEEVHALIDSTSIYKFVGLVLDNVTTARARINVHAKLASDPKQKEKLLVKECWELWQREPTRYKGKAAFKSIHEGDCHASTCVGLGCRIPDAQRRASRGRGSGKKRA